MTSIPPRKLALGKGKMVRVKVELERLIEELADKLGSSNNALRNLSIIMGLFDIIDIAYLNGVLSSEEATRYCYELSGIARIMYGIHLDCEFGHEDTNRT